MSDRPENAAPNTPSDRNGWHAPQDRQPVPPEETPSVRWRRINALPENLNEQPATPGAWHLPASYNTRYERGDQIEIPDETRQLSESTITPAAPAPEDLLAEILGQSSRTAAPRPEDLVPRQERKARTTTSLDADETTDAPPETEEAELSMDEAPDEDDEALSMSELMALASLEEQAQQGATLAPSEFGADDLTPAERKLYNLASEAERELPAQGATARGEETVQFDTAEMDTDVEDAAAYARRMAEELAAASGDTSTLSGTQPYATGASQQGFQQQLSPEEQQLAERFNETMRQVQMLRQAYNNGQINDQELQMRLQDLMIQDGSGDWWMIGREQDLWYRYNTNTGQWEEQQPPVPVGPQSESPRTETGQLDPNEVIAGSLPYLPTDGRAAQEFSSGYGDQGQDAYGQQPYDPYGQQQGDPYGQYGYETGDTPIPNPGQPPNDPNLTQVSDAFDQNTLPSNADTIQNFQYSDAATIESGAVADDPYGQAYGDVVESPYDAGQGQAQPQQQYDQYGQPIYDTSTSAVAQEIREEQRGRTVRNVAIVGIVLLILVVAGLGGGAWYINNQYQARLDPYRADISNLLTRDIIDFQTARILDANGGLIAELATDEGRREVVSIEEGQVSPFFIHAIVSAEDPTFFENAGTTGSVAFQVFWQSFNSDEVDVGTSTITEEIASQLIDDSGITPEDRAVTEATVANQIANQYSRAEILQIYINDSFFGNGTYGVEAAAEFYFGEENDADGDGNVADDLNMAEAALLVGLLPSPNATNPVANREAAFDAMRVVMDQMTEVGCLPLNEYNIPSPGNGPFCITEETLVQTSTGSQVRLYRRNDDGSFGGFLSSQIAEVEVRNYELPGDDQLYPHFVNFVIGQIEATYGPQALTQRGFTVYTTLVPRMQERAQSAVEQQVLRLSANGINTGAVIVLEPDAGGYVAIRALVGSRDFNDQSIEGQVDSTREPQQPGAVIQPLLYMAGLDPDQQPYLTPASILWDVPSSYNLGGGDIFTPSNDDDLFRGPVPVRDALQQTLTIPAVKAYQAVGEQDFRNTAQALGLSFPAGSSFTLRTAEGVNPVTLLDLTHAYATIANDGRFLPISPIDRITENVNGAEVDVLFAERPEATVAVSEQSAYLLQNILSDHPARNNIFGGAGEALSGATLGLPNQNVVAAIAGERLASGDLMTVGFTNNFAVGTWIGTWDDAGIVGDLNGVQGAAPVWNAVMAEVLRGSQTTAFQQPTGIVQNTVCELTGTLSPEGSNCPNRSTEIYINSAPPPSPDQGFVQTIEVDSWTGRIANEFCPENVVSRTFANVTDPFALPWLNDTTAGQQLLQILGLPQTLEAPPTESCQQGQSLPTIRLSFPQDGVTIEGDLTVTGQISAQDLQVWQLLLASAGTQQFQALNEGQNRQVPASNSELAVIDTRQFQNGQYTFRLNAISNAGGTITRDRIITIENIPPTPTPTPIPSATPIPTTSFEPLPFDDMATPVPFIPNLPTATTAP